MKLPHVIILSHPRSGTHLLLSYLTKHPMIHGRGEMFLKYKKTGILEDNADGKLNIAIVMYSQLHIFLELLDDTHTYKIIHLLREPVDIALSLRQMTADKLKLGAAYRAHYHNDQPDQVIPAISERGVPDLANLEQTVQGISKAQKIHVDLLNNIRHLQIHYEDLVSKEVKEGYLSKSVERKLLKFIGLKPTGSGLYTTYVKTGLNIDPANNTTSTCV